MMVKIHLISIFGDALPEINLMLLNSCLKSFYAKKFLLPNLLQFLNSRFCQNLRGCTILSSLFPMQLQNISAIKYF